MKKIIPILLIVFTSFVFLIFIFALLDTISNNIYVDTDNYNSQVLSLLGLVTRILYYIFQPIMIISVFILSFIGLLKLKKIKSKNKLAKSTYILSLVISSIGIFICIILTKTNYFVDIYFSYYVCYVIIIGFMVCFGFSIGSYYSLKKNNEIIDINNNNSNNDKN